ncbi:hypothetical protein A2954_05555 [Candidatus Roizmanbacteria bacterium RIFCSPLOWO2_01_FULL_37_12]|uniref:Phosphoribosyltransferase domain-containing protein n=1 Tax=Candidatus Roizmanbacteria bacterium RIFCSPLOWO2_01_FULL_37_12 TaxID=1802056 RepID=A0A1F7IBG2_9BACT|nr:MAG: hypothetical protein A2954_05555 [Candidatus Roizmanbacteria bacterium RIFCSPLOWO2_01_FULL_37_12]
MFLKDIVFPKFCLGCGYLGAYICTNCKKKLSYIKQDNCLYCGKASLYGLTHPGCRREKGVDGLLSLFYYNNLLKAIIKSVKYRLATDVWKELCLVIEPDMLKKINVYKNITEGDIYLEPIPLHRNKLRTRGFNQAKIIADFFNRFLKLQLSGYLMRSKDTSSQAQMKNNKDRYSNMLGAFEALEQDVNNKRFVLVDDIVTTGSTVKEAARVLKRAGAKNVFVLTLAKG